MFKAIHSWDCLRRFLCGQQEAAEDVSADELCFFLAMAEFSSRFDTEIIKKDMTPAVEIPYLLRSNMLMQDKSFNEACDDFAMMLSVARIQFRAGDKIWDIAQCPVSEFIERQGKENIVISVQIDPLKTVVDYWNKIISLARQKLSCSTSSFVAQSSQPQLLN